MTGPSAWAGSGGQPPPAVPRDAATLVPVRQGPEGPEVLLTRRPATMAFAPGMHVFPGGTVEPGDRDARLLARSSLGPAEARVRLAEPIEPDAALAFFVAALREAFEEVGLPPGAGPSGGGIAGLRTGLVRGEVAFGDVCDRLDAALSTDRLVPIARWVTPPSFARRFDARFLAAPWPPGLDPEPDPDEVAGYRWLRPVDALDAMRAGELSLWLPTASVLGVLEELERVADLDGWPVRHPLGPVRPPTAHPVADGVVRLAFSAAGGVPGRTGAGALVGRERMVVVDPADPTPTVLEWIGREAAARGGTVDAVVVTRVDPWHAAGALDLADRLGVPACCGHGGAGWLPVPFIELGDGEAVPGGDLPLRVTTLGRGDRGRIALYGDEGGPRIDDEWTLKPNREAP